MPDPKKPIAIPSEYASYFNNPVAPEASDDHPILNFIGGAVIDPIKALIQGGLQKTAQGKQDFEEAKKAGLANMSYADQAKYALAKSQAATSQPVDLAGLDPTGIASSIKSDIPTSRKAGEIVGNLAMLGLGPKIIKGLSSAKAATTAAEAATEAAPKVPVGEAPVTNGDLNLVQQAKIKEAAAAQPPTNVGPTTADGKTIPAIDPNVARITRYTTIDQAKDALIGAGQRGTVQKIGKGNYRVVFESNLAKTPESVAQPATQDLSPEEKVINNTDTTFVRHGETDLNGTGATSTDRIRGWTDVPLNDTGRKAAQDAANEVARIHAIYPYDKIYASPLSRSQETAQIFQKTLEQTGSKSVPIETRPELMPWDVGDLAGKPTDDVLPVMHYLIDNGDTPAPGNGETFNQFKNRFLPVLQEINNNPDHNIVIGHTRTAAAAEGLAKNGGDLNVSNDIFKAKHPLKPGGVMFIGKDWNTVYGNTPAQSIQKAVGDIPSSLEARLQGSLASVKPDTTPSGPTPQYTAGQEPALDANGKPVPPPPPTPLADRIQASLNTIKPELTPDGAASKLTAGQEPLLAEDGSLAPLADRIQASLGTVKPDTTPNATVPKLTVGQEPPLTVAKGKTPPPQNQPAAATKTATQAVEAALPQAPPVPPEPPPTAPAPKPKGKGPVPTPAPPTAAPEGLNPPSTKMSKADIDVVTRDEVKGWSDQQLTQASAQFPRDKRLQTILNDEFASRQVAKASQQPPITIKGPGPNQVVPSAPPVTPLSPQAPVIPNKVAVDLQPLIDAFDAADAKYGSMKDAVKAGKATPVDLRNAGVEYGNAKAALAAARKQALAGGQDIPQEALGLSNQPPKIQGPARPVGRPQKVALAAPAPPAAEAPAAPNTLDLSGAKTAKDVQANLVQAIQKLIPDSQVNKLPDIQWQPSKAYGGREGTVFINGEPAVNVDNNGTMRWGYGTDELRVSFPDKNSTTKYPNNIKDTFPRTVSANDTPTERAQSAVQAVKDAYREKNPSPKVTLNVPNGPTFNFLNDPETLSAAANHIANSDPATWQGIVDAVQRKPVKINTDYGTSFNAKDANAPGYKLPGASAGPFSGNPESGGMSPELLTALGTHAIGGLTGALAGYGVGTQEQKARNAWIGGVMGVLAPSIIRNPALIGKYRSMAMLSSPVTVAVKALGDQGAVLAEALEGSIAKRDPAYAKALLRNFYSKKTLDTIKNIYQNPEEANEEAAKLAQTQLVRKGPLSWAPRALGALTEGTQDSIIRGLMQYDPTLSLEDAYKKAKDLTFAGTPENSALATVASMPSKGWLGQAIMPFARIGTNLFEKGMHRIPGASVLELLQDDVRNNPELRNRALFRAGVTGPAAVGAGYLLGPDSNDKSNTQGALKRLLAAAAGPYALPVELGMIIKDAVNNGRNVNSGDMAKSIMNTVSDRMPLPEHAHPVDWTASLVPNIISQLTKEYDQRVSGVESRKTNQDILDPIAANIPGLRQQLPEPLSQTNSGEMEAYLHALRLQQKPR